MPDTFADVRVRFTNPDTTPYFSRGSDPIIALVFGELNVDIPTPDSAIPSTMCQAGESVPSVESMNIAAAEDKLPTAAGHRVPTLSDSLPLIGPSKAMNTEPDTISSAACRASYPSPCIR